MRPHGQTKLGFFPLPAAEAKRLKNWLTFPERFSAIDGPVKLSFFGSLGIRRVQDPDIVEESGVRLLRCWIFIASKLKTVQLRAEAKDYRDIVGTLNTGLTLAEGLSAAVAIYGKEFNGALSLKALTFFEDGDLPSLTPETRKKLLGAATSVNLQQLPFVAARPGLRQEEE